MDESVFAPTVVEPWWQEPTAEERAAYNRQGRCADCGAGYWIKDGGLNIRPHDLGCPTLSKIAAKTTWEAI